MEGVGIEGISGFVYSVIVLILLNLIPCSDPYLCSDGYVENSVFAL